MNTVISCNQSAFILDRLTMNNIMITHELLHSLHKLRQGKEGKMVVKLDMSKAYDRVEWPFIEAIMRALDFCEKWVC